MIGCKQIERLGVILPEYKAYYINGQTEDGRWNDGSVIAAIIDDKHGLEPDAYFIPELSDDDNVHFRLVNGVRVFGLVPLIDRLVHHSWKETTRADAILRLAQYKTELQLKYKEKLDGI